MMLFVSICIHALFASHVLGQAQVPSPVSYEICPEPGPPRVRLVVAMTFRGSENGKTKIQLPSDYYGTSRLHEFVSNLEVSEGASISKDRNPATRTITHDPRAQVTFRYTMAFDPEARPKAAYRPSVGADHFHFLGPQWMARVSGEAEVEREFTFRFKSVPRDWIVFGSFGVGAGPHTMHASWDGLISTVLGGGRYAQDRFAVRDRPVFTFTHGPFAVGTEALFRSVRKIVAYQRDLFRDYGQKHFIVTLTARPRFAAGTSIENAMICYVDPQNELAPILRLLAHEMFHQWLPNKGRVDPGDFEERFDWFDEGFTEYCARRLLLDQGLITRGQYVEMFNHDLSELARNPHRSMTNEGLRAVRQRGKFTNIHYRLSYLRGALIALDWNFRIVEASKGDRSLVGFMQEFMRRAVASGGVLPVAEFQALLEKQGVRAREDIQRWIERAEPIRPASGAMGAAHTLRDVALPEPGFDWATSKRRGSLVRVARKGPAYRAGLRNGMTFISLRDTQDAAGSVTVTVRTGGTEREVTFVPAARMRCPQYVPLR